MSLAVEREFCAHARTRTRIAHEPHVSYAVEECLDCPMWRSNMIGLPASATGISLPPSPPPRPGQQRTGKART